MQLGKIRNRISKIDRFQKSHSQNPHRRTQRQPSAFPLRPLRSTAGRSRRGTFLGVASFAVVGRSADISTEAPTRSRWRARRQGPEQERGMIEDTAGRTMVRAAMKAPYLEREEEHLLALRWKEDNDQQALHRITVAHMRLVISMASRVSPLRPAARRPDPGGSCRPARSRGAFRAGPRSAVFDLCDMVDPRFDAGLHPAQLVDRARRHQLGAKGAVLQPAAPARPAGERCRTDLQRLALPRRFPSRSASPRPTSQ